MELNTVLLYIHRGAEFDAFQYPQCELIIHIKQNDLKRAKQRPELVDDFDYDPHMHSESSSRTIAFCWKLYEEYSRHWSLSIQITPINKDVIFKLNPIAQYIDRYGKVRKLLVRFENAEFTVDVSPIPPLNIRVMDSYKTVVVPQHQHQNDIGQRYCNYLGVSPIHYTSIFVQYLRFSMDVGGGQPLNALLVLNEVDDSIMNIYTFNEKIARYLMYYTLYYFSDYVHTRNVADITSTVIDMFASEFMVINENVVYDTSDVKYVIGPSNLLLNGKIQCKDRLIFDKLVFNLRHQTKTNEEQIRGLRNTPFMRNFCQNITDFDTYDDNVLVYKQDGISLRELLMEYRHSTLYMSKDNTNVVGPYFYLNEDTGLVHLGINAGVA
jgi:hypothetical protein